MVGMPRIGLGLQDPQPCVLPLYYSPFPAVIHVMCPVGLLGIEPSLHEPESCVLPVYDSPTRHITGQMPVCTFQDSNLRPFECESNALTN